MTNLDALAILNAGGGRNIIRTAFDLAFGPTRGRRGEEGNGNRAGERSKKREHRANAIGGRRAQKDRSVATASWRSAVARASVRESADEFVRECSSVPVRAIS